MISLDYIQDQINRDSSLKQQIRSHYNPKIQPLGGKSPWNSSLSIFLEQPNFNFQTLPASCLFGFEEMTINLQQHVLHFKPYRYKTGNCLTLLTNNDSIPHPIGSGSFGEVYQIHWNDGESKALKMIRSDAKTIKYVSHAEKCFNEMRNEMDKMKKLDNRSILKVHYFFRQFDNGIWYDCIVMDLYDMNFFEYKMKREHHHGQINSSDREKFITCLFEAILVLYVNNIHHLDIKPNNFLVKLTCDETIERIVLGDFGQAKMMNEETNWYNKCGNPLFAPPECWSEDTANRDQWGMATSMMFALMSTKAFYGLMLLPYQQSNNNLKSIYRAVPNV